MKYLYFKMTSEQNPKVVVLITDYRVYSYSMVLLDATRTSGLLLRLGINKKFINNFLIFFY